MTTQTPDQQQPEPPLLPQLERCLESYGSALATEPYHAGRTSRFSNRLRFLLARIYGGTSEHLTDFPQINVLAARQIPSRDILTARYHLAQRIVAALAEITTRARTRRLGKGVFIGHGRSPVWRELKDFIHDRLHLPWDEFNREPVAGRPTTDRLQEMLERASFAFLIMTAEEEHADASIHARPNVIHEIGLFQGRIGLNRAIVLLEDGCSEFTNIIGLSQIRFPRNQIDAAFEEVRRVLEREEMI